MSDVRSAINSLLASGGKILHLCSVLEVQAPDVDHARLCGMARPRGRLKRVGFCPAVQLRGARPRAPQQRPRDCATRLCTLAECAGGRDLPRVRHLRRPWVLAASGRVEERHQDGGRLPSRRYSRSCGPGRGPAEPDEGWWWVCLPPFICWLVCVVWRQVVTCSVRRRHCWCQRRTGNAHGDHAADD